MMARLDDEIRAVEARIARERDMLAALIDDCEDTARNTVAAPKSLLVTAALGFALGEMLRPAPTAPARKRGLQGLLAGVAFALIRARYGSPWMLARRIWSEVPRRPRQPWYPAASEPIGPDDAHGTQRRAAP